MLDLPPGKAMTKGMMKISCLCGKVTIETTKPPDFVNECNCTLCRKSGARWGYFTPAEVVIEGTTSGYSRHDKEAPAVQVCFCPECGSTTHFVLTPHAIARFGKTMVGVNMALAEESQLIGVEWRYPDGLAWSGEGPFDYLREARIVGQAASPD